MAKPEKSLGDILQSWTDFHDPKVWPLPTNRHLEGLSKYEFSTWSQNGEDGILRHLITDPEIPREFVEIGFHATECNCIRLALRHGFSGTFFDADSEKCGVTSAALEAHGIPCRAKHLFADVENIVPAMRESRTPERIGVLSIDIDGNDLWLMERIIESFDADIIVVEYNASFGPLRSVSVPYEREFDRKGTIWHGASIQALNRVAERNSEYFLAGCDSKGINAFFLNSRHSPYFDDVPPDNAWRPHYARIKHKTQTQQEQWLYDLHVPVEID